jgi:hypothetical protein
MEFSFFSFFYGITNGEEPFLVLVSAVVRRLLMMNSRCWRREWGSPVTKGDALFNDLLLQMTRAAWHRKEYLGDSSGELGWLEADACHTSRDYKFIPKQSFSI